MHFKRVHLAPLDIFRIGKVKSGKYRLLSIDHNIIIQVRIPLMVPKLRQIYRESYALCVCETIQNEPPYSVIHHVSPSTFVHMDFKLTKQRKIELL